MLHPSVSLSSSAADADLPTTQLTEPERAQVPPTESSQAEGAQLVTSPLADLVRYALHLGHQTRHWNPKMRPYIYGKRSNSGKRSKVHIINLWTTLEALHELQGELAHRVKPSTTLLVVGTSHQARAVIESFQAKYPFAYVTSKWVGGLLTNWPTMRSCLRRLSSLEVMVAGAGISKKDLSKLRKNQDRLETFFGGLKSLNSLPDYMIILGQQHELIAVKESNTLKIPNITILDTNCNPDLATYKIPGNDDSLRSLYFLLRVILQAFFVPKSSTRSVLSPLPTNL